MFLIKSALDNWDIQYCNVSVKCSDMPTAGTHEKEPYLWQVDNNYYLKRAETAEIVEVIYKISETLSKSGIQAAIPISTKERGLFVAENDLIFYLMPKLFGETFVDFDKYDWKKYGFLVGQAIARLHTALRKCEASIVNIKKSDNYSEVINWAIPKIKKSIPAYCTRKAFSLGSALKCC